MARDLAPDVERLLERQPNPYIRKKAALCAIRCAHAARRPGRRTDQARQLRSSSGKAAAATGKLGKSGCEEQQRCSSNDTGTTHLQRTSSC
jgi:hypothetical protein